TVSATDGFNTGSTSFTWTVNDITTPVVTNPGNQTNNEGAAVSLAITATDSDGDPLTYSASNLPTSEERSSSTGVIFGTLGNQAAGTYSVTISATDGFNTGSTSFTWTVNDVTTPVVTNPGNRTSNEGASVSLAITATDSDGDSLTFSASNLP